MPFFIYQFIIDIKVMNENNIFQRILKPSARGKVWQIFVLILILVMAASLVDAGSLYNRGTDWLSGKTNSYVNLPKTKEISFRLGLDLQGGTHLVYQADVSGVEGGAEAAAVEGVRDVIERRVNVFGVSEPLVQANRTANNEYRIIVELAGVSDVNEAIKMIGETPLLEFKEQGGIRELTVDEEKTIKEYNIKANIKAEELLGKLLSNGDFAKLAEEYDEREERNSDGHWVEEVTDEVLVSVVKNLEPGEVSDLIEEDNSIAIVKLLEKRIKKNVLTDREKKEVKAKHILICHEDSEGCDGVISKEEAYEKIKNIKAKATPSNFVELAMENSDEPGAEDTGGDLLWFTEGEMLKPFEEAVFAQEVGTISYVVETKFGYHIIYKEDERVVEEYRIDEIFIAKMQASDILEVANDWQNTELTGEYLEGASVQFNPNNNRPEVSLNFDNEGSEIFEEITERNINNQVAIFLDGLIISAPTVNSKITGGSAVISGSFNIEEAKLLAQRLNAGALPVPINLINQKTVGASLGKASVENSLKAGFWGLILVALFMIVYYRLPGLLAVLSLTFYGILVLAIFKLWPVTLTLAGLAGFILSIGMAVDANVLIFERFREEIKKGKEMGKAISLGFTRAWPSIRDGNVSTLITCFILIQFSTSVVKGFAITLGLGVLVSMFSAIVITKNLLLLIPETWLEKTWVSGIKK